MAAYYFDSSGLVKWYVVEAGTPWVDRILSPRSGHEVYTVRVAGAEVVAAFAIRLRTGTLTLAEAQAATARFRADLRHVFVMVDVTESLVDAAMTMAERHGLRGYDAIHLASALSVQGMRAASSRPQITFVSADGRLNAAAAAEGLPVEDPTTHV
jgi:predicted nucleic acid-binding protein